MRCLTVTISACSTCDGAQNATDKGGQNSRERAGRAGTCCLLAANGLVKRQQELRMHNGIHSGPRGRVRVEQGQHKCCFLGASLQHTNIFSISGIFAPLHHQSSCLCLQPYSSCEHNQCLAEKAFPRQCSLSTLHPAETSVQLPRVHQGMMQKGS